MYLAGHEINVEAVLGQLDLDEGIEVSNNIVTQCPWPENHASGDAHPSFAISLQSGAWLCYAGCNHGGIVHLVQLLKELDEAAARRWLLQVGGTVNFGIPSWEKTVPVATVKDYSPEVAQADYALMDSTTTSSYFLDRGFTTRTIKEWGIRYDRNLKAIVVPIHDFRGQLVGTIRRMVPPISTPTKYLYNKGFQRSRHLFGAFRHSRTGPTVVTEGPLDALWLHQLGYTTAVALMGSFCSNIQVDLLLRLSSSIIIALDGDDAGQQAVEKLLSQIKGKLVATPVQLPTGKDVQDLDESELSSLLGMYITPVR